MRKRLRLVTVVLIFRIRLKGVDVVESGEVGARASTLVQLATGRRTCEAG
jgi:hypothetical protein